MKHISEMIHNYIISFKFNKFYYATTKHRENTRACMQFGKLRVLLIKALIYKTELCGA